MNLLIQAQRSSARSLIGYSNAKTIKGESLGYVTGILYLAPSDLVQGINTCPKASLGCREACLFTAGRGAFSNVMNARISKTEFFRDNRKDFMLSIVNDIQKAERKAIKDGMKLCIRLNGTSDIVWESIKIDGQTIFEMFPHIQFYDYTKIKARFKRALPKNYHLTFSRSESNESEAMEILGLGHNVAMVFAGDLPKSYRGFEVISGDDHDLRFLDKRGVIVGLKAKGKAKKDTSGFVIK